jgi:hypothetical protein
MATCETCGNDYDNPIEVTYQGRRHTFDCFECAIERLAPRCAHCGCRIIGHGVEQGGTYYCCTHCARHADEAPAALAGARA